MAGLLVLLSACSLDPIENPNAPTIESLEDGDATLNDLRLLASGLEASLRVDMEFHYWTLNVVGREYWDLRKTDPRYTGELLGRNGAQLDNNGFLTTRAYATHYRTVRNAWVLIHAADNNRASLTGNQKNAFKGFARTIMGYALLMEATRQYENGIRTDVEDPDNLGPFTANYLASLRDIAAILDQANNELNSIADVPSRVFQFSSTLADPNGTLNPTNEFERFRQFNRALAARVALYQSDEARARGFLAQTWVSPNADLDEGIYHVFGLGGNNIPNPLYTVPEKTAFVAHPDFMADAEPNDPRVAQKTTTLATSFEADGLAGNVQATLFASNVSPFPVIRNEELLLMLAEANVGFDNDAAVQAINAVRAAHGLSDYAGATDDASLINQILHERRYSLFGEGHRWIDMRRFGRLAEIPSDRPGDVVHVQFPRPILEQ